LPWKSEWAKKCVTTYLPNQLALKMDDAKREWKKNLDQSERINVILYILSCRKA